VPIVVGHESGRRPATDPDRRIFDSEHEILLSLDTLVERDIFHWYA